MLSVTRGEGGVKKRNEIEECGDIRTNAWRVQGRVAAGRGFCGYLRKLLFLDCGRTRCREAASEV